MYYFSNVTEMKLFKLLSTVFKNFKTNKFSRYNIDFTKGSSVLNINSRLLLFLKSASYDCKDHYSSLVIAKLKHLRILLNPNHSVQFGSTLLNSENRSFRHMNNKPCLEILNQDEQPFSFCREIVKYVLINISARLKSYVLSKNWIV